MGVVILWIVFSAIIGSAGKSRKIGGAGAFFCSLLLSPIIGLFAVLLSKSLDDEKRERDMLETQRAQLAAMNEMQGQVVRPAKSVAEQLESLLLMKQAGHLTEDEYQAAKAQAIAGRPAPVGQSTSTPPEKWRPERDRIPSEPNSGS